MHKHGEIKIADGKGVSDMCEMSPDGVARGGVLGIVDFHWNRAAIVFQEKMMRGGSLREGHALFAGFVHF